MRTLGRLDEKSTDKIPRSLQALGLRTYADRIEAAHKHEREAGAEAAQIFGEIGEIVGRGSTREKSSAVGDAAAMRKACANIAEYAKTAACHTEDTHLLGYLNQIESWAEAALSSPPRNCDVLSDKQEALAAIHEDRGYVIILSMKEG